MISDDQKSIQFTDSQREQIERRRVDQDRTLVTRTVPPGVSHSVSRIKVSPA